MGNRANERGLSGLQLLHTADSVGSYSADEGHFPPLSPFFFFLKLHHLSGAISEIKSSEQTGWDQVLTPCYVFSFLFLFFVHVISRVVFVA